jgi:hypothetical protein
LEEEKNCPHVDHCVHSLMVGESRQHMWRGIQKPRLQMPNLTSLLQSEAMSRQAATRPMKKPTTSRTSQDWTAS